MYKTTIFIFFMLIGQIAFCQLHYNLLSNVQEQKSIFNPSATGEVHPFSIGISYQGQFISNSQLEWSGELPRTAAIYGQGYTFIGKQRNKVTYGGNLQYDERSPLSMYRFLGQVGYHQKVYEPNTGTSQKGENSDVKGYLAFGVGIGPWQYRFSGIESFHPRDVGDDLLSVFPNYNYLDGNVGLSFYITDDKDKSTIGSLFSVGWSLHHFLSGQIDQTNHSDLHPSGTFFHYIDIGGNIPFKRYEEENSNNTGPNKDEGLEEKGKLIGIWQLRPTLVARIAQNPSEVYYPFDALLNLRLAYVEREGEDSIPFYFDASFNLFGNRLGAGVGYKISDTLRAGILFTWGFTEVNYLNNSIEFNFQYIGSNN